MTGVPVVHLSGIGPVDATALGAVGAAGLELEFEHDSDWSALGDGENGEDPDSNSEGYYGNDYPEVTTCKVYSHFAHRTPPFDLSYCMLHAPPFLDTSIRCV